MMRFGSAALAAACLAPIIVPAPAAATTVFPEPFTCPIGGEQVEDYVVGSYSTFGQRPGGRPYGTLPVYPLVECPGNGFLLVEAAPPWRAILVPLLREQRYRAAAT